MIGAVFVVLMSMELLALMFLLARNAQLLLARNAQLVVRARRAETAAFDARIGRAAAEAGRDYWRRRYDVEHLTCVGLLHILRVEGITTRVTIHPPIGAIDPLDEFTRESVRPLVDEPGSLGGEP